jgi:hypothetical protein
VPVRVHVLAIVLLASSSARADKYDDAVKLLARPATWCAGAKQLVALKNKRAIVPIVLAFERPVEADKACLGDAIDLLGGAEQAPQLIASKDATERRVAIHLMILYSSDDNLEPLDAIARRDPDLALRQRARDALAQQGQTAKWERVIAGYLAVPDDAVRGWAIDLLIRRNAASSWQRLQDHLSRENNPELKAKIQAALAKRSNKD